MKVIKLTENDLVQIIKKVLNEQTPKRKRFIHKSQTTIKQNISNFSSKYKKISDEGKAIEDNEEFLELYRNAQVFISQETKNNYVKSILVGDSQISLWDSMLKDRNSPAYYFAADVIKKVIESLGRNRYKYARIGTRKSLDELTKLPKKQPGENVPTPPEIDTIILPSTVVQQDFFVNNSWELKQPGKDEFDLTFISPYETALKEIRETYPNAGICMESIYLEASASRFRNQGQAKDLSFEKLSIKRASTVAEFLIKGYKRLGAQWCKDYNVKINAKGQNGDGSSGPNPPKGYSFLLKGDIYDFKNFKIPGTVEGDKYEPRRNEFGTPLTADKGGEKAYEQFRYVRPTVKIQVFYDESTPDTVEKTQPITEPPQEFKDPENLYWAVLYKWSLFKPRDKKSSKGRSNRHGRIKTSKCSDDTDVDKCARKGTKDAEKFRKGKVTQIDYH